MTGGPALERQRAVSSGEMTAAASCETALEQLERHASLNAVITMAAERGRAQAAQVDGRGGSGPLAGVPIAIKDNICTRGLRTTAASRVLEHYVPPYDATVIERLEAAGAVIVAKTNADEFAMGSSSEHSAFGPVRNPWDVERTAGGSSGGSAALVAARAVPLALGSETGGSVRQPAALCGVVGLKPTYGRISRYGLIAFASSLDQVGIFGTTVGDVATCLGVIAGHDARDATSRDVPLDTGPADALADARGLRIGIPSSLLADGVDAGVDGAFREAVETLRSAGAEIVEVDLPHSRFATATYAIVVMAEASSNLSRFDGVRYGTRAQGDTLAEMYTRTRAALGAEVKRRIMLGTYVLSGGYYDAYYVKAQRVRALIRRDYERAFERADLIATPTSPTTAFRLGERLEDPVKMYLADVFTVSANLAGIPAVSLPCGLSEGLPVGLQLTGPAWSESRLLRAGAAYERLTRWWTLAPPGRG
jgi:aspartyl-tRNA(Asn)/glutamyl-tRNA(Gln) amidotransferase subunit A